MRDYSKESEWEKTVYKKFVAKLKISESEKFDGISKVDFLRWCIKNGIIEKYKNDKK